MSEDFRELEDQVIYLSQMLREVVAWMDAAEMAGTVPEGLRSRMRDQDRLNGILIQINAVRETLGLLDESGDMGVVQSRLRESLSEMVSSAQELKRRTQDEETKKTHASHRE